MKKFKKLALSILSACCMCACVGGVAFAQNATQEVTADSVNLVNNGDFSDTVIGNADGAKTWQFTWSDVKYEQEYLVTPKDDPFAPGALRIHVPYPAVVEGTSVHDHTHIGTQVTLYPNTLYCLSVDIGIQDAVCRSDDGNCGFYTQLRTKSGASDTVVHLEMGYESAMVHHYDLADGEVKMSRFQRMFMLDNKNLTADNVYYLAFSIWAATGTMYVDNVSIKAVDESDDAVVLDSSFEADALYGSWNAGWRGEKASGVNQKSNDSHTGSGSLYMRNPRDIDPSTGEYINEHSNVASDVYLVAGQEYTISGWIKAGQDFFVIANQKDAGATLSVQDETTGAYIGYAGIHFFEGGIDLENPKEASLCEWRYYESSFTATTTGRHTIICSLWYVTGSAYFDDVKLTKRTMADDSVKLNFAGANLSLHDSIYIQYAVAVSNNVEHSDVKVLVWKNRPTDYSYGMQDATIDYDPDKVLQVGSNSYPTFAYTGISFKEITKDVYACVYVNIDGISYYSKPLKYSVLQYAYNKLGYTNATPTDSQHLKDTLNYMLKLGTAYQNYDNYEKQNLPTDKWTYVNLSHAVLPDGFSYGLYNKTADPNLEVGITLEAGYKVADAFKKYFRCDGNGDIAVGDDGSLPLIIPDTYVDFSNAFVKE